MGEDTNRQESTNEALWTAIKANDAEGVKKALVDGVEANAMHEYFGAPLHYAANDGHTETCKLLRQYVAK